MIRNRVCCVTYIALLAFLLNVVLPFFAVYNVPHATALAQNSAIFGEKILICTSDGFRWATWQEIQQKDGHSSASHYKCPLCYLAAHGLKDFTAPASPIWDHGRYRASFTNYHLAYSYAFTRIWPPFTSRAPPHNSFS